MDNKSRKQINVILILAMVISLLAFMLGINSPARLVGAAGDFSYYRLITIESDYVYDDLVNFPIAIDETIADLATVANGGDIENTVATGSATGSLTVPADFDVGTDNQCTTSLDFEWEDYDAATGDVTLWVNIPSLSQSVDTEIYICYGDSSKTTSEEDHEAVWDEYYAAVWHASQGVLIDSTSNGNDGIDYADNGDIDGQIGRALAFDGNDDYWLVPDSNSLDITGELHIHAYIRLASLANPIRTMLVKGGNYSFLFLPDWGTDSNNYLGATDLRSNDSLTDHSWAVYEWHQLAMYYHDGDNEYKWYHDGIADGAQTTTATASTNSTDMRIGNNYDLSRDYWGRLDEIRISTVKRGNAYTRTTYATGFEAGFLTVGAEQEITPTDTPTPTDTATPTDTPTPTATPTATPTPEPVNMADPSVVISQDLIDEVEDAIYNDPPNNDANMWAITDVYTVGDYSMISLAALDVEDPEEHGDWYYYNAIWTGTAIVRDNGDTTYTTGLDGDATYLTLLSESNFSNPNNGEDQGGGGGNWIWFPFQAGTRAYYGSRGVHKASDALPGWLAVDFVGGTIYDPGTMPNQVYGSYTEPIRSVCRDGTAVGLTTDNFYYLHLEDSSSFYPGAMIRQGQPIGSLVVGPFDDKCGWASQTSTSYHLHWGFRGSSGYLQVEHWVLNLADGIWRNGDQTVSTRQYILAEWPDHVGPIPTLGPTITPGGPTPTPGDPIEDFRVYGGNSLWDPFIFGLYSMAQETAARFPVHEQSGIGSQITSGAEIAIRVAFTMLTSNFDLTISIIIFGLIAAAEVVRLIYALYLGVKKLIPILG